MTITHGPTAPRFIAVGQREKKKTPIVSHGSTPCHLVYYRDPKLGARLITVPLEFGYLLQSRNGSPWHQMPLPWQVQRFEDLCKIDFKLANYVARLIQSSTDTKLKGSNIAPIDPAAIPSLLSLKDDEARNLGAIGQDLMLRGEFARVTLAAGDAARFMDPKDLRPKALVPIAESGPLARETYLSLHARDQLRAQELYGSTLPWLIFVHPRFRDTFESYLHENKHFGLDPEKISFVEHTGRVPKFTPAGLIATKSDEEGEGSQDESLVFGTSGHGYYAYAFRHNPAYIQGYDQGSTPHESLTAVQIKAIAQSNIDNLGFSVSTQGPLGYDTILGLHLQAEAKEGRNITIELTRPLIGQTAEGKKIFWDEGGLAVTVDGTSAVVDTNALDSAALRRAKNPDNPFPFNTASATYGIDAIRPFAQLPPTLQTRRGLLGFETNFWNSTLEMRTGFIIIPRQIPEGLADLPPGKNIPPSRLINPEPWRGKDEERPANRFIPVKERGHQKHSTGILLATERLGPKEALIKSSSRILIVEDDAEFLDPIVGQLKSDGWGTIETATTYAEAEKHLKKNRFDFIILDAVLRPTPPEEETDGVRLLKAHKLDDKALNAKTPILFWTGYGSGPALTGLNPREAMRLGSIGVNLKEKAQISLTEISKFIMDLII